MATAPTTPPSVGVLSTPPNRAADTQTEFSNKADQFLSELPDFGAEQNTLASWQNTTATQVYNNALESAASATASANSATESQSYTDIAASISGFVGNWSDLTGALSLGASVYHSGIFWRLNVNLADVTASEPSLVNTDWSGVNAVYLTHLALTGGGALTAGRVNEIRDGSAYTLPLANSVGANQWIDISLPERYRAFEPVINVAGADTITSSDGADSSMTYDALSWGLIRLTSDGVSNWSI